jgi:hypothetical protein
MSSKKRSRRHRLISFLLDNDVASKKRLQIAYEIEHRFPCDSETTPWYSIVPNLVEHLQEEPYQTPSLDYYKSDYDYSYFTETTNTVSVPEARDMLEQDYKTYVKNQLFRSMSYYLDQDESELDTEDIILQLRKYIDDYDSRIDLRELDDYKDVYDKRKNKDPGLKSFIAPIDNHVQSFELGTMSTLMGESGHYKTTLSLSMMYNNIVERGKNVVFVSLEMDRNLIMDQLMSRHTYNDKFVGTLNNPVPSDRLRDADLNEAEEEIVKNQVWDDLKNNDEYGDFEILGYDDFMDFSVTGLRSRLARVDFEIDGVIVDHIQETAYFDHSFDTRYTNPINYYVRAFSQLTKDVDGTGKKSHVMLLSQVNKEGFQHAQKKKGQYHENAVAEGHTIKRESTVIWSTYANDEDQSLGQTRVYIPKNRLGAPMKQPEIIDVDPGMLMTDDMEMGVADDLDPEDMF